LEDCSIEVTFRINNKGGDGTGCFEIDVKTDRINKVHEHLSVANKMSTELKFDREEYGKMLLKTKPRLRTEWVCHFGNLLSDEDML